MYNDSPCNTHHKIHTNDTEMLNYELCDEYNREGQLCGKCKEGFGPPVYSYTFSCVKCRESDFKLNLMKCIAAAFIPLTVFFFLVIIFKVRVTSGPMVVYVLISQLLSTPLLVRHLVMPWQPHVLKYVIAFFAVWNLDILRSLYKPFCIHPSMTMLQALALDYLVGVYPLLLIALTYIFVTLHGRYALVVRLWRPLYRIFINVRKEWNIRGSLVQAFATFLVLSYVKILNVSFDLLTPVSLSTVEGKALNQVYVFNAGSVPYFGKEHRLYGILAGVMLALFNILPIIVLLLYPCSCVRRCLSCCGFNSPAVHIFMDTFHGSYRHQPRDCRYFAALYLFARFMQLLTYVGDHSMLSVLISGLYMILLALSITIFKPYKQKCLNKIDPLIFLMCALGYFMSIGYLYIIFVLPVLPALWPYKVLMTGLVTILVLFGSWVTIKKFVPMRLQIKLRDCARAMLLCCCKQRSQETVGDEEAFLHASVQR